MLELLEAATPETDHTPRRDAPARAGDAAPVAEGIKGVAVLP